MKRVFFYSILLSLCFCINFIKGMEADSKITVRFLNENTNQIETYSDNLNSFNPTSIYVNSISDLDS